MKQVLVCFICVRHNFTISEQKNQDFTIICEEMGISLMALDAAYGRRKVDFLGAFCFLWEKAVLIKVRKKFYRRKGSP